MFVNSEELQQFLIDKFNRDDCPNYNEIAARGKAFVFKYGDIIFECVAECNSFMYEANLKDSEKNPNTLKFKIIEALYYSFVYSDLDHYHIESVFDLGYFASVIANYLTEDIKTVTVVSFDFN